MAVATTAFVAGCSGDSGGDDSEATTATTDGATTTGQATTTDGRTRTEQRTKTTEATTTKSTRTTDLTDTRSAEPTRTPSGAPTENPYRQPTPMGTPTENGLAIVAVHPTQEQRGFISGEYVTLRNTGNDPLDLSGYSISTLRRSGDPIDTYSLTLEPGATLYALTRSGEGTVLESMPPGYLRYAGYDEPILNDDSGTVVVTNADGETVLEQSYGSNSPDTQAGNSTNET